MDEIIDTIVPEPVDAGALTPVEQSQIVVVEAHLTPDNFETEFSRLGFYRLGNDFYQSEQVQVGEMVVNGQHQVQTVEQRLQFKYLDFHGTIDDTLIDGFEFSMSRNGQVIDCDMCYMSPDDVEFFVRLYTGKLEPRRTHFGRV